jgi:hypothetical protein
MIILMMLVVLHLHSDRCVSVVNLCINASSLLVVHKNREGSPVAG